MFFERFIPVSKKESEGGLQSSLVEELRMLMEMEVATQYEVREKASPKLRELLEFLESKAVVEGEQNPDFFPKSVFGFLHSYLESQGAATLEEIDKEEILESFNESIKNGKVMTIKALNTDPLRFGENYNYRQE